MSVRRATILTLLVAVGAALMSVQFSDATFSAQRSNPGNSLTAAASFCSNPGLQTVTANRDTWIQEDNATSNNGTDTKIKVKPQSDKLRRALVGFNLPSVPSGCSLTTATLTLFSDRGKPGRTIRVQRIAGSWGESTATWANQPAVGGTGTTSASVGDNTSSSWTVTTQVQAMYSGANNGLMLRDANEGNGKDEQQYQARDATPDSQDPKLTVSWG